MEIKQGFKKQCYQTLEQDLNSPLDKVYRGWIRRPCVIILTPVLVIGCMIEAGYKNLIKFYDQCW